MLYYIVQHTYIYMEHLHKTMMNDGITFDEVPLLLLFLILMFRCQSQNIR